MRCRRIILISSSVYIDDGPKGNYLLWRRRLYLIELRLKYPSEAFSGLICSSLTPSCFKVAHAYASFYRACAGRTEVKVCA